MRLHPVAGGCLRPAIADRVVGFVVDAVKKRVGTSTSRGIQSIPRKTLEFRHMTHEEQAALIEKDPATAASSAAASR
jgi:hypothetical protein